MLIDIMIISIMLIYNHYIPIMSIYYNSKLYITDMNFI